MHTQAYWIKKEVSHYIKCIFKLIVGNVSLSSTRFNYFITKCIVQISVFIPVFVLFAVAAAPEPPQSDSSRSLSSNL